MKASKARRPYSALGSSVWVLIFLIFFVSSGVRYLK